MAQSTDQLCRYGVPQLDELLCCAVSVSDRGLLLVKQHCHYLLFYSHVGPPNHANSSSLAGGRVLQCLFATETFAMELSMPVTTCGFIKSI